MISSAGKEEDIGIFASNPYSEDARHDESIVPLRLAHRAQEYPRRFAGIRHHAGSPRGLEDLI